MMGMCEFSQGGHHALAHVHEAAWWDRTVARCTFTSSSSAVGTALVYRSGQVREQRAVQELRAPRSI